MQTTLKIPHTKPVRANKLIQQNSRIQIQHTKINTQIQHTIAFLHTNHEQSRKEITKTIPFTMASKRTKHLNARFTIVRIETIP